MKSAVASCIVILKEFRLQVKIKIFCRQIVQDSKRGKKTPVSIDIIATLRTFTRKIYRNEELNVNKNEQEDPF